ncbi:DUF3592 domain-containing protein [Actinoplanes sp. NPDC026619]|uniref:DUF3592 domain-containing protein n=1 Tax=Actinoplanes sp. NPDC026619 TaxID=3155798 RepID=UPI0034067923
MIDEPGLLEFAVSGMVVGIPVLVGLVAIVAGIRRWRRTRHLALSGQSGTAVVSDNQQVSRSESRVLFLPVVRFRTTDGREIQTVLDDAPAIDHI